MFGTNMGANMKSQGRNFELNIRRCCQSVKIEVQSSLQSDSKYLFLFLNSPSILFKNALSLVKSFADYPQFLHPAPKHANIADLTILSDTAVYWQLDFAIVLLGPFWKMCF